MNWVKCFALVTCLATPLSMTSTGSALAAMANAEGGRVQVAQIMDAKNKAKAADCSKQADEKKLHGDARRKFRASCIKG